VSVETLVRVAWGVVYCAETRWNGMRIPMLFGVVVGSLLAGTPVSAAPQVSDQAAGDSLLKPGAIVRLHLADQRSPVKGVLEAASQQVFVLLDDDKASRSYPAQEVRRIEVLNGRRNHWLMGLLVGLGAGVVAGLVEYGVVCSDDPFCVGSGEALLMWAGLGGGVGALVGAFIRTDDWVEVPTRQSSPSAPTGDARAVVASLSWRF
jgi:hypothetical protein